MLKHNYKLILKSGETTAKFTCDSLFMTMNTARLHMTQEQGFKPFEIKLGHDTIWTEKEGAEGLLKFA